MGQQPHPCRHHHHHHQQLHDKFFSIRSCFLLAVSNVSPAGGPHYSHTRCMSFSERERGTYVSFLCYIPNTDVGRHGYAFPFGHTSYTVTLTLGCHIPLSLFFLRRYHSLTVRARCTWFLGLRTASLFGNSFTLAPAIKRCSVVVVWFCFSLFVKRCTPPGLLQARSRANSGEGSW